MPRDRREVQKAALMTAQLSRIKFRSFCFALGGAGRAEIARAY